MNGTPLGYEIPGAFPVQKNLTSRCLFSPALLDIHCHERWQAESDLTSEHLSNLLSLLMVEGRWINVFKNLNWRVYPVRFLTPLPFHAWKNLRHMAEYIPYKEQPLCLKIAMAYFRLLLKFSRVIILYVIKARKNARIKEQNNVRKLSPKRKGYFSRFHYAECVLDLPKVIWLKSTNTDKWHSMGTHLRSLVSKYIYNNCICFLSFSDCTSVEQTGCKWEINMLFT